MMQLRDYAVGTSASATRRAASWPQVLAPRNLAAALALAISYLIGVAVGLALTFEPNPVSTLWPPNAIVLAALLLTSPRVWPLLIVAVLPAHVAAEIALGVPLDMALCWFVSNVTESLLGAALTLRVLGRAPRFDRVRDVATFLLAGVAVGPLLSSFLDAYFVQLVGWRYTSYWEVWRVRLFSNALAALAIVPLVVTWLQVDIRRLLSYALRRKAEAVPLLAGICVACVVVFQRNHTPEISAVLMYAPLPLLIWAAVRHDPTVVALCIAIVAMFAITGVLSGRGPFTATSTGDSAVAVQTFLIIAASSLLLLVASLAELRDARSAARRQEESLNLALGAARIGTWEWDFASDHVDWRAGQASGVRTRRARLARILDRVHADDRSQVQRIIDAGIIDAALVGSGHGEAEFRFLTADGSARWIISRGKVLVDRHGNPQRMIGVYLDTTESKLQELQMREHREQLAYLSRLSLMGELSGALAHELNQPLAAILLNAQAACVQMAGPNPNLREITEMLRDIVADDQRAGQVIHRLRALFIKGKVQTRPLSANECIGEVLELERSYLIASKVTVDVRLAKNLPHVAADRVQLQQVLLNLIVNACDAMAGNEPRERRLCIESRAGGDASVEIVIRDIGHGIQDAQLIFEPFFSTKENGVGLGLSVSRSIIAAHGGRLWAVPNARRGATFHISLPAAQDGQGAAAALAAGSERAS